MKLLTILLLSLTTLSSKAQNIIYTGNSRELLKEEIDMEFIGKELTERMYKVSDELKRFEYSKYNPDVLNSSFYDSSESAATKTESVIYSRRKRVTILPFVSMAEAMENPGVWEASIKQAKNTDAHYVIRGIIENARAEPKLTKEGSQRNVKTFAGFEGSIQFNIQIYDLEQDIELEDSKLSDRGLLKTDIIKGATGVLNVGSQLLGKGDVGYATKSNVNSLVDQSLANTKKEAMYEAINRSEKYLRQLFAETFPMYFPFISMTETPKDGIEFKFLNYPDSELIKGHKVDLILLIDAKEESFGLNAVEKIDKDRFYILLKGKDGEKIKKALEESGSDKFYAKLGKEKLTTKAKISNMF
jgi:hypothetical protein